MKQMQLLFEKIVEQGLWSKKLALKKNEYLKVSGTTDTNLYFVMKGSLRIFVLDDRNEHTIRFGYKNNLIGDLESFITESPSEYYIQAIKATQLKVVTKQTILQLNESAPELQKNWTEILELVLIQQLARERDLLTISPVERLQRVSKRSPLLFQEIPSKYIASYLRMTPETLSRIKKG
ncbi:CRP-like cAMP-binding protein [Ulvibacter sp. MAR_2010_11]|uniref:Crp/Fnr family transcriptional regulator n=1 Tax=Ulvibacter sp. MAR_2010_11 TaxID=1250229 RepID=UPI000C2B85AB|nr:Crp/Fnr family transcriptional regulator [Ulvibacter sp. MAR_2010_11]PKA82431.1 CRP-like cAMP-binding protein [Ulvibacter sp. MAR_2010_11]